MEIRWNRTTRARWDKAARHAPWQQHWAYGVACEAMGSEVLRAEICLSGQTIALAQMVTRRFLGLATAAVCTRGPFWVTPQPDDVRARAYRLLRRSAPIRRPRGIFLTPEAPAAEHSILSTARLARVMTPYSTARIDLTESTDVLRARMRGKWRNRLVHAEGTGLRVIPQRPRPGSYDWLLDAETAQQRTKRYQALSPDLVPEWQTAAGHDSVAVFTASTTERVAAMLFLLHGRGATYHIGWSDAEGRRTSAHNLLLWRAIKSLKRRGIQSLDLGGLNTVDAAGIARFRLGAGADLKTLCGTWF